MADRHHYVPQLLLRNFATDDQIWLFDKSNDKSFKTNIKNAFVEGDYNTVVGDNFTLEAEQIFCRAEDMAAPVLKRVLDEREVKHLNDDDRAVIATFVTIQHLRSKQSRRTFGLIREHMQSRFPGIPQSDFTSEFFEPHELDKHASLDFLARNLSHLATLVAQKDMVLIERGCHGGFWISDHPVILHNDNPRGHASNTGLAVPGIQIYMPISPLFVIAFFCPTIAKELEDGAKKIAEARSSLFAFHFSKGTLSEDVSLKLTYVNEQKQKVELQLKEIREDRRVRFDSQNLIFLNSHQVLSAYRFLASDSDEFALAIDMIHRDPQLRQTDHIHFS
ncbi:hypothetical protein BH11PSE4_BH11PSE4_06450 [soil metagenome]